MAVLLSPYGGVGAQFLDNSGNVLTGGKIYTYAAGTTTPQVAYTSAAGTTPLTNPIILDAAGRVPTGEIWLTDGLVYKFVLKDSNDVLIATYDNIIGINSNFLNYDVQEEIVTATAGQTVFTLTSITYQPGTNSLSVFIDGVNQYVGQSYVETDSSTVTFTSGLHDGAEVKFSTSVSISSGGSSSNIVTYTPAGVGAVTTTVQNKLRETISVNDFIPVGTNTLTTDCGAYIQEALDHAEAIGAKEVYLPNQFYQSTIGLKIPNTVTLRGNGVGAWDVIFPNRPKEWTGTTILFKNTGTKDKSFAGITDLSATGGWRTWGDVATVASIVSGGSGYTNGEAVVIASTSVYSNGSGATGTVTVSAGAVTAVTVVDGGDYFVDGETVSITAADGTGTGATGVITITNTTTVKLSNWMNTNAAGATKATPKLFSAAITNKVDADDITETHAYHWGLKDLRIAPWIGTDGYSDYSDTSVTSLGDDWSVGLLSLNSEYEHVENVQVVGYWREAAILRVQAGYTVYGSGERGSYTNIKAQGYRGLVLRASDIYPVTASTATTVEIPWTSSQYWDTTGFFEIPGGVDYSYSGLSFAGDKLTFTGVSPDASALTGNTIRSFKRGTGIAGSIFTNATISGLNHTSGLTDVALGFTAPGVGFEISGFPIRGYEFYDFKVQNRSIEPYNSFFGECEDTFMFGCQFETGVVIASPLAANQLWATYPGSVETIDLRLYAQVWSANKSLFTPRVYFDESEIFNPTDSFTSSNFDVTQVQPKREKHIYKNTGKVLQIKDGDGTNLFEMAANSGNTTIKSGRQLAFEGGVAFINAPSTENLQIRNGTTSRLTLFGVSGNWGAGADNTQSWGTSSARWSVIYAGTGTINTSDQREKQQVRNLSVAERNVAKKLKDSIKAFKFNDAVQIKGEKARIHVGVIAQEVIELFKSEGLDANEYGVLCYDKWDYQPAVYDHEGNLATAEVQAGDRYGVRYEELFAFIISAL